MCEISGIATVRWCRWSLYAVVGENVFKVSIEKFRSVIWRSFGLGVYIETRYNLIFST